eukprot:gene2073-1254_t
MWSCKNTNNNGCVTVSIGSFLIADVETTFSSNQPPLPVVNGAFNARDKRCGRHPGRGGGPTEEETVKDKGRLPCPCTSRLPYSTCVGVEVGVRESLSRIIFLPVLPLLIIQENGVISSDTVGYQVCEEEYIYISSYTATLPYTPLSLVLNMCMKFYFVLFDAPLRHVNGVYDTYFRFLLSHRVCDLIFWLRPVAHWHSLWWGCSDAGGTGLQHQTTIYQITGLTRHVSVSDSDSDVSPLLFVQREDRSFLFHFSSRFGYRYHTSPALLYAMKMGSIIIFWRFSSSFSLLFRSLRRPLDTKVERGATVLLPRLFFFTSYFCGPTNLGNATRADSPAESTSFALSAALSKGPLLNLTLNPVSKRERGGAL